MAPLIGLMNGCCGCDEKHCLPETERLLFNAELLPDQDGQDNDLSEIWVVRTLQDFTPIDTIQKTFFPLSFGSRSYQLRVEALDFDLHSEQTPSFFS
ncbi:MAG: hypothetical protein HC842_03685 [Cytophagales bacterium]|nr:hypothetical protein [Cytophagales bacterium]